MNEPVARADARLSETALAARLSFFLWSSIPDDELLNVAASGRLSEPGELDRQVLPYHADGLAELARARKGKADVQAAKIPGVNHLFVAAKTGEVDEYGSLGPNAKVSEAATSAIATRMRHPPPAGSGSAWTASSKSRASAPSIVTSGMSVRSTRCFLSWGRTLSGKVRASAMQASENS